MRTQPVIRKEDHRLLVGTADFVDDLGGDDTLHLAFARSINAHALIRGIDIQSASSAPGIIGVYLGTDVGIAPQRGYHSLDAAFDRPPLAIERVRFVGEPLVAVVARSRSLAADAAELVEVDYESLPVVVDQEVAAEPDAPQLFPDHGTNVALEMSVGEPDEIFDDVDHVISARFVNQRLACSPMEPNSVYVEPGADGRLSVWLSTQRPHAARDAIARALELPSEAIRVIAPHVGGGFGGKFEVYPELFVAVWVAHRLGRSVKYIEARTENLMNMPHGRGQIQDVELGLHDDGTFHGLRVRVFADAGAYPSLGALIPNATQRVLAGQYRFEQIAFSAKSVATNTTPVGAYRGAGRPEAITLLERIIDIAADELGVDPIELRRRNMFSADEFPVVTATGAEYDTGSYAEALEHALETAGYADLRSRQAEQRRAGSSTVLGIGVANWVDATPFQLTREYASLALEVVDGRVEAQLAVGTSDHGQGHDTTFSGVVERLLGISTDCVTYTRPDTDVIPRGDGTGSARSAQVGGGASHAAGMEMIRLARLIAGDLLEADPEDVAFDPTGTFAVQGVPSRTVDLVDVVEAARTHDGLSPTTRQAVGGEGLRVAIDWEQVGSTYPSGSHVAVVDVDTQTGSVALRRFIAVDDCGVAIEPTLVRGQQHGGTVQGISQALFEGVHYDRDGNPLTSTFIDYLLPSAADVPSLEVDLIETPTFMNPLGAKGIGQGGAIGAAAAVQNAVVDAVSHLGVRHIDMPLSPFRVWSAIHDVQSDRCGEQTSAATKQTTNKEQSWAE